MKPQQDRNIPIQGSNGLIYQPEKQAEALAEVLKNTFKPHLTSTNLNHQHRKIRNEVNSTKKNHVISNIQPTTISEIKKYIKKQRPNKAPGPDNIRNILLRNLTKNVLFFLALIFNASLNLLYFPTSWKQADIITIPKQGKNPHIPHNRRPISLLSCIGKIYEDIILNRLKKHLNLLKVIPLEQFGFTAQRSTTHQLVRLMEYVSGGFNMKQSTISAFLDIEKAYDTTWHTGLIYKLKQYGVPLDLLKIIISYLQNRTFN